MACKLKTALRRAKWFKIWESGVLVEHTLGTFDLVVFKVVLFGAFCTCLKWPVTPYLLAV